MKKITLAIIMLLFGFSVCEAKVKTSVIEYKHGGTVFEGFLAYDDEIQGKRPGVAVVHEWWGINDHIRTRAVRLAELGYVAFAIDVYGKGIRPSTVKEAEKEAGLYISDRWLLRERVREGVRVLEKHELTDRGKIAAIGFCFGGMSVLEYARSGADIGGVVSFHGSLNTPDKSDAKNIKAKVLVLHGAEDPFVKTEEVQGFIEEMRGGLVNWQLNIYSSAVHSFTNPNAGHDPSKGIAYNRQADERSWEAMKAFLTEVFR